MNLSKELVQWIVNYLQEMPYKQVAGLLSSIQKEINEANKLAKKEPVIKKK